MNPSRVSSSRLLALALVAGTSVAARAQVQSYTWIGGGAQNPARWSDAANWQNGVVPNSGQIVSLLFSTSAGGTLLNNDIGQANGAQGLTLDSLYLYDRNWSIFGNPLSFRSNALIRTRGAGTSMRIDSAVRMANGLDLLPGAGSILTLTGGISGAGRLTKGEAGTVVLSGTASTYTGGTTVSNGTLRIEGQNLLPTSTDLFVDAAGILDLRGSQTVGFLSGSGSILTNGNTLTFDADASHRGYSGEISGAGGISLGGPASFTLSGRQSYTGTTTLRGNTLVLEDSVDRSFFSPIVGNGGFTKAGTGGLTLSARSSYSGATSVQAGSLVIGVEGALPAGTELTLAGGTALTTNESQSVARLIGSGTVVVARNFGVSRVYDDGVNAGFTGAITGAGDLIVRGDVGLTGDASGFTGDYVVESGQLRFSGPNRTIANLVTGAGSFGVKGGFVSLTNRNTYTGGTFVTGGVLDLAVTDALPTTGLLDVTGTVSLRADATIGALNSALRNPGTIALGDRTLTIGNGNGGGVNTATISGAGNVTKIGTGDQFFQSPNTYTGATNILGGTLGLFSSTGANLLSPSSLVTVDPSGTLALFSNQTLGALAGTGAVTLETTNIDVTANLTVGAGNAGSTFGGTISGAGSLTKTGTGQIVLTGANAYTGGTSIAGGSLGIGATNTLPTTGAVNLASGTRLVLGFDQTIGALTGTGTIALGAQSLFAGNGDVDSTFAGSFTGSGAFHKIGNGRLELTGANGFTGSTVLDGGVLAIGGIGTYASPISGATTLEKFGSGTLTLTRASTYGGSTLVTGGTLALNGNDLLPTTTELVLNAGTTLDLVGGFQSVNTVSGSGNVRLNANNFGVGVAGPSTYDGVISGTGALYKRGTAALTLSKAQTYTGGTFVERGSLVLNGTELLAPTGDVDLAAGTTLDLAGGDQTIDALSGTGTVKTNGNYLYVGSANGSSTFGGVLTGPGVLAKNGTGTLTLTNAQTSVLGALTFEGTLRITSTSSINGGLSVFPGATFENDGADQSFGMAYLGGTVRTSATGVTRFDDAYGDGNFTGSGLVAFDKSYAPGESDTPGDEIALITAEGDMTFGANSILTLDLKGPTLGTGYDHLTIGDRLTFGGALVVRSLSNFSPSLGQSFDLFDWNSATGTFGSVTLPTLGSGLTWDQSDLYTTGTLRVTQAVPEPATLAVLGLGGLALLRRRRRA